MQIDLKKVCGTDEFVVLRCFEFRVFKRACGFFLWLLFIWIVEVSNIGLGGFQNKSNRYSRLFIPTGEMSKPDWEIIYNRDFAIYLERRFYIVEEIFINDVIH